MFKVGTKDANAIEDQYVTTKTLGAGDAIKIPSGSIHRISNNAMDDLVMLEFRMGVVAEGEESTRMIADDYGRMVSDGGRFTQRQ